MKTLARTVALFELTVLSVAIILAAGPTFHAAARGLGDDAASSPERINMVIGEGIRLGSDTKLHDAYTPVAITALQGQTIIVTVYNYDQGRHTFTSKALHLNATIAASPRLGVPATTVFKFSVLRPGTYQWRCFMPCDDPTKGWAMLHSGYMAGAIRILEA